MDGANVLVVLGVRSRSRVRRYESMTSSAFHWSRVRSRVMRSLSFLSRVLWDSASFSAGVLGAYLELFMVAGVWGRLCADYPSTTT